MKTNSLVKRLFQYNVILPFLFLFFIGTLVYQTTGYEWRSAQLPFIVGSLTLALILLEIGIRLFAVQKAHRREKTDVDRKIEALKKGLDGAVEEDPRVMRNRLLMTVASIVFYLVFLKLIGYLLTSLILSVALIRILGYKKYLINVLFSLLFVGGSYAVFGYVLGVNLPLGMVFEPFFGD